jgi:hypothetical protein
VAALSSRARRFSSESVLPVKHPFGACSTSASALRYLVTGGVRVEGSCCTVAQCLSDEIEVDSGWTGPRGVGAGQRCGELHVGVVEPVTQHGEGARGEVRLFGLDDVHDVQRRDVPVQRARPAVLPPRRSHFVKVLTQVVAR